MALMLFVLTMNDTIVFTPGLSDFMDERLKHFNQGLTILIGGFPWLKIVNPPATVFRNNNNFVFD